MYSSNRQLNLQFYQRVSPERIIRLDKTPAVFKQCLFKGVILCTLVVLIYSTKLHQRQKLQSLKLKSKTASGWLVGRILVVGV